MTEVKAYLAPNEAHKSRRQDQLSQETRDLMAWAFREGIPASELLPMPINAFELLIGDNDLHRLAFSDEDGGGVHKHGGSDSLCYMKHAEDEKWALVFAHDCDGDADRGAIIAENLKP